MHVIYGVLADHASEVPKQSNLNPMQLSFILDKKLGLCT